MGWNAGAFGRMTFPSPEAMGAWLATTYRHDAWSDWIHELEHGSAQEHEVHATIDRLAKRHDPAQAFFMIFDRSPTLLEVAFDGGEDDFRELAGDLAALLRSAAEHGATGSFDFLGTAGAEGDFVYRLTLADGTSSLLELDEDANAAVHSGPEYGAHMHRLTNMLAAANPAVREALELDADDFIVGEEPAEKPAKPKAAKKPAAKKAAKPAAKKPAAKKAAKPAAKKPAAKKAAKKAAAKKSTKKPAKKPAAKKPAKKKR